MRRADAHAVVHEERHLVVMPDVDALAHGALGTGALHFHVWRGFARRS